jgi:predicted nucleic acid-binding protein
VSLDAYDADVLIYASIGSAEGDPVRALLQGSPPLASGRKGIGSLLLLPETLTKPTRLRSKRDLETMAEVLSLLELIPCDAATAELAVDLGARYGLKTVDAVHLATAVRAGADRFITNNRRDFPKDIEELDVTYPEDLVDAATGDP